jgi:hypothetical protein
MSKSNSPFIEGSKHQEMSSQVEAHILGGAKPEIRTAKLYGDTQYNPEPAPSVPDGSGFNYVPDSAAGHTVK